MYELKDIRLTEIMVAKHNPRIHGINTGIEELTTSIKANGQLEPIIVYYNQTKKHYIILAGQRRFHAFNKLDESCPGEGFDKIQCLVREEPKNNFEKLSLGLADNITSLPMTHADLTHAVTNLFEECEGDHNLIREQFGISDYMIKKYVSLARLPDRIRDAINNNEISDTPKMAENAALRAIDALQYGKNDSVKIDDVVELARLYIKSGIPRAVIDAEVPLGGSITEIKERATHRQLTTYNIKISKEIGEKLRTIAKVNGETTINRATSYVTNGTEKDYQELYN